jgi:hypothetical protein
MICMHEPCGVQGICTGTGRDTLNSDTAPPLCLLIMWLTAPLCGTRRTTKESKWTAPEEWKRAQAGKAAAAAAPGAKPVVQVVKAEAPAAAQVQYNSRLLTFHALHVLQCSLFDRS